MAFCIEKTTRDDSIREHGHPHHTALRRRQYTYNIRLWRVRVTIVTVGKTVSIKYHEGLYVALAIRHVNRNFFVVSCDLSGSTIFSHIIS